MDEAMQGMTPHQQCMLKMVFVLLSPYLNKSISKIILTQTS
jgi:hypothetical protein